MNIHTAICLWLSGEESSKEMKLEDIINTVSEVSGASVEEIKSRSRKPPLPLLKFIYYSIARKYTFHSLGSIGNFTGADHSSILYGIKTLNNLLDVEDKQATNLYRKSLEKLKVEGYSKTIKQKS